MVWRNIDAMREKATRRTLGTVPVQRAHRQPPPGDRMPRVGTPAGYAPPQRAARLPKRRGVGAPPNPRTPKLVRDVHGGALKDMFEIFPDLPRLRRPAPRLRGRATRRTGKPPGSRR